MRIYLIDLSTGKRDLVWLRKREVTLDVIRGQVVQHRKKYPLHLRFDGYNLTVTDYGLPERVKVADTVLELGQPRIWLPHQELQIGERYLLSWAPSNRQPTIQRQSSINYWNVLWLARNPRGWLSAFLSNFRRGFGYNLERIVPLLLAIVFIGIFGLSAILLWYYVSSIDATIAQVPPPTLTPVAATTTTGTPAPMLVASFPSTPFPPTVVRVNNLADLPPTPTEVGALPPGVTPTPIPCVEQTLGRGDWDTALDALQITFKPACVRPGEQFWHLIEAKWLDVDASNGYHHVFVDLLDEDQQRVVQPPTQFVMQWTTGQCNRYIRWESDPLGYGAHCPMYAAGAAYRVYVEGLSSDMIEGIGLGSVEQRDWAILTSYQFKFQRTTFNPQ